jgi:hypothetical protein
VTAARDVRPVTLFGRGRRNGGIVADVTASRFLLAALIVNLAAAPALAHEADSLSPAPRPNATPPPTTPVGAAEAHLRVWPFVLVGVGALTLGTGIWLVHRDHTDPTAPPCMTVPGGRTTCPYGTATTWQGWAFVAVGAELALAGIAWRIYEVRHTRTSVSLAAGLGNLRLSGTF